MTDSPWLLVAVVGLLLLVVGSIIWDRPRTKRVTCGRCSGFGKVAKPTYDVGAATYVTCNVCAGKGWTP